MSIKLLKNIKGFDDVGIGIIVMDEGRGDYIRCVDLQGYDLTDIQIYKYNTFFRTMSKAESVESDSSSYIYCVKRRDIEGGTR